MAMPQGHLVAFCSDVGIPVTHGSTMLSVLLACAFLGRQLWGAVADRVGGFVPSSPGSACQVTAMLGFLLTQNEAGLFFVAATFGLGFSGLVPAYVLAVRELFPASQASVLGKSPPCCCAAARARAMAWGGWLAGAIYDYILRFYAAAFAAGIVFNLANLLLVGALVFRQSRCGSSLLVQT